MEITVGTPNAFPAINVVAFQNRVQQSAFKAGLLDKLRRQWLDKHIIRRRLKPNADLSGEIVECTSSILAQLFKKVVLQRIMKRPYWLAAFGQRSVELFHPVAPLLPFNVYPQRQLAVIKR